MVKYQMNTVDYKSFPDEGSGRFVDLAPLVKADGRKAIGFDTGMRKRVEVVKSGAPEEVRSSWWDCGFWTADGVLRNSDGSGEIVYDSEHLRNINAQSELSHNGGLVLRNRGISGLNGIPFTSKEVEKYGNKLNTRRQAKNNPFLRTLARENQDLLNEYVDLTFDIAKKNWNLTELMAVHFPNAENISTLRPWWLAKLDFNIENSSACGYIRLDGYGRVVGVGAESLEVIVKK